MPQYAAIRRCRIPQLYLKRTWFYVRERKEAAMLRIAFAIALIAGPLAAQSADMPRYCGTWSLAGTYAVSYQGWLATLLPGATAPVMLPGVNVGVVSIDSLGQFSGATTLALGGQLFDAELVGGSLNLNADCTTGTITIRVRPKGATGPISEETDRIVVFRELHEIQAMAYKTTMGVPMVSGTWKRIAPVPNSAQWDFK
jgi:hypothetical protein